MRPRRPCITRLPARCTTHPLRITRHLPSITADTGIGATATVIMAVGSTVLLARWLHRALGVERIAALEHWVHPDLQPDCTWLFDVPLAVARERLDRTREQDRFEQEADAFFERTRAVYLARAQQHGARIQRIDATQTIEQIRQHLSQQLDQLVTMRGLA